MAAEGVVPQGEALVLPVLRVRALRDVERVHTLTAPTRLDVRVEAAASCKVKRVLVESLLCLGGLCRGPT